MSKKIRIDQLLLERGLVESRSQAQRLVMAGQVRVEGQVVPKSSSKFSAEAEISVDQGPRFVSRGGEKLQAAFDVFPLDVNGKVCADVGASTGGFTDCLLQHGAHKVYAIDVGKGVLHWNLRQDARVQVMEETNARYLTSLPELVAFVTVDVSFISLKVLLPVIRGWLPGVSPDAGEAVVLIKPQFEAGRKAVARGKGVIRDPEIHRRVIKDVFNSVLESEFNVRGLVRSPVLGPKGNVEFLAWLVGSAGPGRFEVPEEVLIAEAIEPE